jgi:hypothetical protein
MGLRGRIGHWMKVGEIDGKDGTQRMMGKIDLKKVEVGNVWVLDDM